MQTEVVFAGFGGQGVLFAGQLLSYAAMDEGRNVTWYPSYGPEMRGGTANCTVIISDSEIGSPVVRNPTAAVAMNLPSLDKYEPIIHKGGVLVVNSSIIARIPTRTDIRVVLVPANDIAERISDKRLTNMVLLGALLANLDILPIQALEKALQEHLPARHHKLLPANYQALREGASHLAEAV
ncbi:MAG TPA: 2-oxoacid:acceptor oxidoreductase family protein [Anaerolineaceae bacterium]|nr:2-oxoacid:acceptor oxidoreductase family protein [Anaerolineaceae bacterium]